MLGEALKLLKYAGLALIIVIIVAGGFYLAGKAKSALKAQDASIDTMTANTQSSEYTQYVGQTITGADVINVINKTVSDSTNKVGVGIKTKAATAAYVYASSAYATNATFSTMLTTTASTITVNSNIYNVIDVNNVNYINPTATFTAQIGKNTNGSTNYILFTQQ